MWRSDNGSQWNRVTDKAGFGERYNHSVAVLDGKLWVMGGKLGDYQDRGDVWASSDGSAWTQVTASASWTRRSNHASLVFADKIWIMGGYLETSIMNPVYRNDVWYSSDGKNWTCATSQAAWPVRGYFEAVAFDNKMWILGGCGSGKTYNDMWYSTDGATWTQATSSTAPWKARYDFQSVVYDKKIWVIAGIGGSTLYNDVWYYDAPTGIGAADTSLSMATGVTVNALRSSVSGGPVTIRYTLHKTGSVRVTIYSSTGREVRTVWNGVQSAGARTLSWDGCDAGGKRIGAGAYFVRLQTGGGEVTRKTVAGGN